ncbi:MAG: Xaa-Pro peptidase family protein [Acidobacteriaceae bacterium]
MVEVGERRAWIIAALVDAKLDAILCSASTEVLLLTGYWPVMSSCVAIHTADGQVRLIVPKDEVEFAQKTSSARLIVYEPAGLNTLRSPLEQLRAPLQEALEDLGLQKSSIGLQLGEGVQPSSYSVAYQFRSSLVDMLRELVPEGSFKPCDGLLDSLKAVKTAGELALIEKACLVAAAAFVRAETIMTVGSRETDVAAAVQSAFDTTPSARHFERSYGYFFCMSGPNSAKACAAFARTRNRKLEMGDLVMIHCNTCADGYWTDITRTYTVGAPSDRHTEMREAIMQARAAGFNAIRPGVAGCDVDRAVRDVMKAHGLGDAFKHASGHGVGFAAANPNGVPRIHPLSRDVLQAGMTFNVEPAAYFDGYGGMRHCDVVAVTEDGVKVLTQF